MSFSLVTENIPARDLVLRKLRGAILTGRFRPGQRLRERELVERMGVSRTPIREALRKLELEGLVTTVPYKGPVVTRPTLDDARELYQARAALEGQAVVLFTQRRDPRALAQLREAIARGRRAVSRGRPAGVLAANNAFHDTLAAGCGNALLHTLISNLRDRIVLLRVRSLSQPGRRAKSVAEHRAIARLIEHGRADAARRLTEQHIMRAWQAARSQLVIQQGDREAER